MPRRSNNPSTSSGSVALSRDDAESVEAIRRYLLAKENVEVLEEQERELKHSLSNLRQNRKTVREQVEKHASKLVDARKDRDKAEKSVLKHPMVTVTTTHDVKAVGALVEKGWDLSEVTIKPSRNNEVETLRAQVIEWAAPLNIRVQVPGYDDEKD